MSKEIIKREVVAGITTFLAMSYIIVVNPSILATQGTGMPFNGVMTATIMAAFFATLLMGAWGKLPFALAPGMGLNAFFTYTLILGDNIPWPAALGLVFWAGVIFLIISVFPLRTLLFESIPLNLRSSMGIGIGLFLTFIGLQKAGIIIGNPVTLVTMAKPGIDFVLFAIGAGVTVFLFMRKSIFSLIGGIIVVTVLSYFFTDKIQLQGVVAAPDFSSTFFKLDLLGSLKLAWFPSLLAFVMTDFFDTLSAFVGMSENAGLIDEKGNPKNLKKGLIVDSLATIFSGLAGTSPTTTFIESGAGVEVGGKTGLTAIVCAFCFLPFLFLSPLLQVIPAVALSPVLVVVGCLMFKNIKNIDFSTMENALPAFLTIIIIPLSYSITEGIMWGLLSHFVIQLLLGKVREIPVGLWVLCGLSLATMVIG